MGKSCAYIDSIAILRERDGGGGEMLIIAEFGELRHVFKDANFTELVTETAGFVFPY